MWKLVVAQMCHLYAAPQQWDRTDVSSVKLAEAYSNNGLEIQYNLPMNVQFLQLMNVVVK